MAQVFDYFVCARPLIHEWADALQAGDRERQSDLQARMERRLRLKQVSPEQVNVLARCAQAAETDVVETVSTVELVRALDVQRGPWIMGFSKMSAEALAQMQIDEPLLERWLKLACVLGGGKEDRYRKALTAEAAESIKELCSLAHEKHLGVFSCSHG